MNIKEEAAKMKLASPLMASASAEKKKFRTPSHD